MHGHGSVSRLTSGTNGDFSVEQMDASVDRFILMPRYK
jgi:hypothetical protein